MPDPPMKPVRRARAGRRYVRATLAAGLVAGVGVGVALALAPGPRPIATTSAPAKHDPTVTRATTTSPLRVRKRPAPPRLKALVPAPFAVGLRVLRLLDASRTIRLPDGRREPRPLITYVRYPAGGPARAPERLNAPVARARGPFPLIVFGHGFTVTPAPYTRLLESWARAGYVVAAPVFPLENANAPGGPDEADLVNQPADMSFVISRLLGDSRRPGALSGLIDPARIAVSGQSDGGETALAVAYDHNFVDHRVGAAVILSGAEIPGVGGFTFPPGSPPLLATQGTADTINPPSFTNAFFDLAPRPKYLLTLIGAGHLPPYSAQQPQLGIVERVTSAFLDLYLKHLSGARHRLLRAGNSAGVAQLLARP